MGHTFTYYAFLIKLTKSREKSKMKSVGSKMCELKINLVCWMDFLTLIKFMVSLNTL